MKRWQTIMTTAALGLGAVGGCMRAHPASRTMVSTGAPATMPAATQPDQAATADLGQVGTVPGVNKKPKPFIKWTHRQGEPAQPSTLLVEHAALNSPVPLSEYANQPEHDLSEFHLRADLSAAELRWRLGSPAQLADNEDPWFVYRLTNDREIWLHFAGPNYRHLLAADVVRGAEDGYARESVFPAR